MKRMILISVLLVGWVFGVSAQSPLALTGAGGPSNCPQGDAAVTAMGITGIAPYDAATRDLVCGLVGVGIFGYLDGLWLLDGYNASAILVNVVNPGTYNLTMNGVPTCTTGGCSGTDAAITTNYFDTGIVQPAPNCSLSSSTGTNCGVFVWSSTNITPTFGGISIGAGTGAGCTAGTFLNPLDTSSNLTYGLDTASASNGGTQASSVGFFNVRGSYVLGTVTHLHTVNNTTTVDSSATFTSAPTSSITILGCQNGSIVYSGDSRRIAVAGVGSYNFYVLGFCHLINQYEIEIGSTTTTYC